jgi:acetyltransferase-like isoleucine patch superfamily enzyme
MPWSALRAAVRRALFPKQTAVSGYWLRRRFPNVKFGRDVLIFWPDAFDPGFGLMIHDRAIVRCGRGGHTPRTGYFRCRRACEIGTYNVIWADGGVEFGDDVHLGAHVTILSHTADQFAATETSPDAQPSIHFAPVVIEDHVIVGSGVVITPGVRIGHHSLIAAGAVVTSDLPPYSFAGGAPARVIRSSAPQPT